MAFEVTTVGTLWQGKLLTERHKGHCKIHGLPPLVCDCEIADCQIRFLQQMERNVKIRIIAGLLGEGVAAGSCRHLSLSSIY